MVVFIIPSGFSFFFFFFHIFRAVKNFNPRASSPYALEWRLLATQVVTASTRTHIAGRFLPSVFSPHFFFLFRPCYLKKRLAHRRTPRAPTSLSPRNSRLAKQANKSLLKEKYLDKNKTRGPLWFSLFCFVLFYFWLCCQIARFIMKSLRASRGRPYPIPPTGNVITASLGFRFSFFNETRV